jgi:ABC-type uncharacterized transport system involved in gliding motility auxiliary subunit
MKLIDKIAGIIGIILLLFSLIYYSIQNIWGSVNWITLILGIAACGYFLYIYYTKRDKKISKRSLLYGSNVMVQSIIVIVILGLIAFITTRRHFRSDWTEQKLYSLADQTEKILSNLDKEVKVKAFFKKSEQTVAQDLLDEYAYLTGKLKYEFIDPDEKPQIAKRYQIKKYGTIVIESGIKREVIEELSQANLTNAIVKVTREQDKVIYFLTGHGERSTSSEEPEGYKQAVEAIKKENHIVRELNLVRKIAEGKGIPDSCTVLVIARPQSNFFPAELDSIKSYLDKGGKAIVLLDPDRNDEIAQFLEQYHVKVGNDLVIDVSGLGQILGGGPAIPLLTSYDTGIEITKDMTNKWTFYPYVCSVIPMEDKGDYDIKELLKTSPNSWAESEYKNPEVGFNEEQDIKGPVCIASIIEKKAGDKKLGLVVFGDSDFIQNGYWGKYNNDDLFLNTINYLAEEEDLISIRPKQFNDRRVNLNMADVKTVFYLVVIIIPLLVVIAGVVFYIRRGR